MRSATMARPSKPAYHDDDAQEQASGISSIRGGGGQAAWTAAMPAHMDTMIQKGKKQHGVNMMGTGRTLQEQASGT
jgi:hypothetical protein